MQFSRRILYHLATAAVMAPSGLVFAAEALEGGKQSVQEISREVDRHFEATLFSKAVPLLKDLLPLLSPNSEEKARARLRLAQCYYFSGEFAKAVEVLQEVNTISVAADRKVQSLNSEAIFLLGLTLNKLNEHDRSIPVFLKYLALEGPLTPPHYHDALFELGAAYFHKQKFEQARRQFEALDPSIPKKNLYLLSRLYLARILITEKQYVQAEKLIETLNKDVLREDLLYFSLAFLKGEIQFSQGNWEKALSSFEEALPRRNNKKADWTEDALFYLGWCYLNLAEQHRNDAVLLKGNLEEAENTFKKLTLNYPSDRASQSLAQCYLLQATLLEDPEAVQKMDEILSDNHRFLSPEALHQTLLFRAEASSSYDARRKLFLQLTKQGNEKSRVYPSALYLMGLNELEEGQRLAAEKKNQKAQPHFEQAIKVFEKTFELQNPLDKTLAAFALKYLIQAHYELHTKEGYLKGLSYLSRFLNIHREELLPRLDDPSEIFYLQGLIASRLIDGEEGSTFFSIAENSLLHSVESYPQSGFKDHAWMLLGALYYRSGQFQQAKKAYLEAARQSPSSPSTAEAFFWAANSADLIDPPSVQESRHLRKKVYEQFSDSPFADEAYFRYYDYAAYLGGIPQSMDHLKELEHRFPESLFRLNALYLLGLYHQEHKKEGESTSLKNEQAAIESLTKLEEAFLSFYEQGKIPEDKLEYFLTVRYQGLLDHASIYLSAEGAAQQASIENGEKLLYKIYTEFEDPSSPFGKYVHLGDRLSKVQEEASYHLAECYLKGNNDEAAERLLTKMLEKYQAAKATRGYYLSRAWYNRGIIVAKHREHTLALQYFKQAEDAAKGKILSADELLDLWIEQSQSLKLLGNKDDAMLVLSRVINYDAVSPNRLRAMYLRAEIYEEQGRLELAKKQLEAVAKKGGIWASKAKIKLEENYVYY